MSHKRSWVSYIKNSENIPEQLVKVVGRVWIHPVYGDNKWNCQKESRAIQMN